MAEAGTEAGEEAIVAVGRTMASRSLNSPISSEAPGGSALRSVVVVRADGKRQHVQGYAASRSTSADLFTAYNETFQKYAPGITAFQPDRTTTGLLREWRTGDGRDEALSAKDMLCPVRGVALAPVLEALWICTDGGKSRIAFALHNLIPTRQQGVCSPIRPSTKPSQWTTLPLRFT